MTYLYFILFLFYIGLNLQLKEVRLNTIYDYVFLYLYFQVWIFGHCNGKPPTPEVCFKLLNVDFMFFCGLIFLVAYKFGLKNFFVIISQNLQRHPYTPCTISGLFFILAVYANRFELYPSIYLKRKSQKGFYFREVINHYLVFTILILNLIKELIKKVYIIILLSLAFQYSFVVVIFYVFKFIIFMVLVSSLAIDFSIVSLLSPYFGPFVLGWLGNIQNLNFPSHKSVPYCNSSELDMGKLLRYVKKKKQ